MVPVPRAPVASALPEPVARWVCEVVGPGSELTRSRALPGASSSMVHAVDVRPRRGRVVRAVLRRYVYPEVVVNEPDPVRREATVLTALERTALPVPRLLGIDPDGDRNGVPSLLMTRLPGRPSPRRPSDVDAFLDGLLDQLPVLHGIGRPPDSGFPRYHQYYEDIEPTIPPWTARPAAWERAIEVRRSGLPTFEPTLVHRDYHPGNVLWQDDRVSGVVDWAWSCIGPTAVDLAHCRLNLALAMSCDVADDLLARARTVGIADDHDPRWDLIDAVDALPDLADSRAALARLDEFVARAVAAC